ncbi:MAG: hypothetical protein AMJ94_05020 [Deltaproteobacteria bacterium SM23_61]|nr:MAG: hypothetical protein AMJ94_05020 [Deltaproteobacteria bacterium SM23_61]
MQGPAWGRMTFEVTSPFSKNWEGRFFLRRSIAIIFAVVMKRQVGGSTSMQPMVSADSEILGFHR